MEKIDLTDKFIHSPNWQNKQDLENFKNIIKSGVLLTPEELSLKKYWFKDKIFFAVHPDSELALEYCGIGYNGFDSTNGYDMASSGVFFILDSKLKKDYDIKPGTYQYECTSSYKIDLYKYLLGIGNAGLNIDGRLVYCYYYIKYFNGEISSEELIKRVRERNLRANLAMSIEYIGYYINNLMISGEEYLPYVLAHNPEDFMRIGNYNEIEQILIEEKKNIILCDKFGYCVNPEKRMNEIIKMKEYVDSNADSLDKEKFSEKIKELVNSVKNKY